MAQTFSFMTKMRATSSAEEKKKLLTARQEAMKKLSPEERKKVSCRRPQPGHTCRPRALSLNPILASSQTALEAKAGYITMYKEYCDKVRV